jgi:hypothetical protein
MDRSEVENISYASVYPMPAVTVLALVLRIEYVLLAIRSSARGIPFELFLVSVDIYHDCELRVDVVMLVENDVSLWL